MTVAITKPVVTHVICSTVTPNEPMRCGTATLTIDASIAPISVPNVIEIVTSHLLTGARAAGAAGRVMVPAVIAESCPSPVGRRWRVAPDEGRGSLRSPHPPLRGTLSRWERGQEECRSSRPLDQLPNVPRRMLHV